METALVLGVFLAILLGGLDLSLAVLRENTLAEAARRLARAATLHGEKASSVDDRWGPTTFEGTADEETGPAEAVRDILVVVDPADVTLRLIWPDGENGSGSRVQAVVLSEYRPIVPSLFGSGSYLLQATSTMNIEH